MFGHAIDSIGHATTKLEILDLVAENIRYLMRQERVSMGSDSRE